jgi:hypothetical protein
MAILATFSAVGNRNSLITIGLDILEVVKGSIAILFANQEVVIPVCWEK